jgi:hypothetical protein
MPEQPPIRTPVRYWTGYREGEGKRSRTRTTVQPLGGEGGTLVVWVEGEGSCISMTHIQVVTPKRIQRRRTKGWRMPDGARYAGRPTKWGNPWRIIPVRDSHFPWGDAADVIHETTGNSIGRFERTERTPGTGAPYWACHAFRRDLTDELIADARRELAGWDLACFCALDQPCHVDTWLAIVNGDPPK